MVLWREPEPPQDEPGRTWRFVAQIDEDAKTRRLHWFHEDEHVFPKTAAHAAKIVRAGGRVGIGSHGQLQGLGYHWEMWALASGGLPAGGSRREHRPAAPRSRDSPAWRLNTSHAG